jgi:Prion-inhibition and propagation
MAEAAGLAMGALGLASLFSTCVECFDYFQSARRVEKDAMVLLSQLEIEKALLLIWGNLNGILKSPEEGRNRALDQHSVAISKGLQSVNSLLSEASDLENKYGLQPSKEGSTVPRVDPNDLNSNNMNVFKTSYNRFWVRFARNYNRVNTLSRTKWAINDKTKFERLIVNLTLILNGLYSVVPVLERQQNDIMERDIASIVEIGQLTSIQYACKNKYPVWSDIASRIKSETENGTIDRRNVVEWLQDVEGTRNTYQTLEDSAGMYSSN